jgi:hypothetical protein
MEAFSQPVPWLCLQPAFTYKNLWRILTSLNCAKVKIACNFVNARGKALCRIMSDDFGALDVTRRSLVFPVTPLAVK